MYIKFEKKNTKNKECAIIKAVASFDFNDVFPKTAAALVMSKGLFSLAENFSAMKEN